MQVREKEPCEFYAVQMKVEGRGVSDIGTYRYDVGHWLLFESPREVDPLSVRVEDAYLVVKDEDFTNRYVAII